MKREGCLSVIIPVYNEAETVVAMLDEVLARPETAEVIVVDDASKDDSRAIVERYIVERGDGRVRLFCQERNQGKGAAVRRGFDAATAPIVIIQDADREYTPEDYPVVIGPILDGKADVVYGSRFHGGLGRVLYFRHQMGNKLLTFLSNLLTDLNLTDMETCYKAFRREVVQNLVLTCNRFGIEVELTAKIATCRALRIYEVPIRYYGRTYEEGKKITWRDGVAALWFMFKFNLLTSARAARRQPWQDVLSPKEK
jgi:glycosyltransferase involved in cell wall biosynthesis